MRLAAGGLRAVALPGRPVLGFDFDLTLVDLRAATARTLSVIDGLLGEDINADAVSADLGASFARQLRQLPAPERRARVARRMFRRILLAEGLPYATLLPGACQAVAAVEQAGGTVVVISGRRADTVAACLSWCGITAGAVIGGVMGLAKADAMREHRIDAYIGDHALDMEAACSVPVPGIGITTGEHPGPALLAAGATTVIDSLTEVAAWLAA